MCYSLINYVCHISVPCYDYFMIISIDLFYSLPKDVQKSVILATAGNVCVFVSVHMSVCVS